MLAAALAASVALPVALAVPSHAATEQPAPGAGRNACTGATLENHASIRLRIDKPAPDEKVAVDQHGQISISGILHKHATMLDVSDHDVTTAHFTYGPPPKDVASWAKSWTTSLRPPHLGANKVCARAARDKHSARALQSFTVVDMIAPSAVTALKVGNITATGATLTWGAATDNYGLSGYAVSIDGGPAHRTTVGTLSYTVTGLAPSTTHTVSVVAVDLAGNTSTPATATFTTTAAGPPPPPPGSDLTFDVQEGGADASWHVDAADATYQVTLNGQPFASFPVAQYCVDPAGNPATTCAPPDFIRYPVVPLEEGTAYTFQVDALRTDGTMARSLSGPFTTLSSTDPVPPAVVQQIASESSQCAGLGGAFYLSPSTRGRIALPAGSTPLFDGCYTVPNSSCVDSVLPVTGNQPVTCNDDVTGLLKTIAPTGRGPVISSVDGEVDYSAPVTGAVRKDPVKPLVESVTWCTHNTACTVVVEAAEEAVAEVAIEVVAAASLSWLLVLGSGIILGLALDALFEFLFPPTISFAGLIEYPIRFDTNFDTFTNWGGEKGKWIHSLKMYAEIVKTTTEVAAKFNIPFAWDALKDVNLKEVIDSACTAQRGVQPTAFAGCGDGFSVYVPGAINYRFRAMPQTGAHIVAAMTNNGSGFPSVDRVKWFYPTRSQGGAAATAAGFKHDWYDNDPRFNQNNACTNRGSGKACDEFPFWVTNQAVNLSGTLADIAPVPSTESSPQGSDISGFYRKCKVADGQPFLVLPLPAWVAAGGPSFGFEVNQGGTELCMDPAPPATPGGN
jgi:chitodextrinase